MHEVKVSPNVFQKILNEVIKIYPIDYEVKNGEVFIISEASLAGSELGRSVYVEVEMAYTFQRNIKRFFFRFWRKLNLKYTSVVLLKLTGMMRINGEDVPMSEPVKDVIYKNLDESNVVDLKLFPKITCVNNKNEVLCEYELLTCEIFDMRVRDITYRWIEKNPNDHGIAIAGRRDDS